MPIDPVEFRRTLGAFATGVTIVTTRFSDGRLTGLTANAFTSVSLEPPLILVCVDRKSESDPAFGQSGSFTVNILAAAQQAESNRFAKSGGDKFAEVSFRLGENGLPILEGCLAYLECRVHSRFDAGDHTIYLGEVQSMGRHDDREPLLYFRGSYREIAAKAS